MQPGPDQVFDRSGVWGASGDAALYEVEVTAEMIAQGRVGDCSECPVALAVSEARRVDSHKPDDHPLRHAGVTVGALISWTTPTGRRVSVRTPARVARWIEQFDDGARVAPFTFQFRCASVLETQG
jgi:hypothetical protein